MAADVFTGKESIKTMSVFRMLSEHSRRQVIEFAKAIENLSSDFTRSQDTVSSVSILSRNKLNRAIAKAALDSPVQYMERDVFEDTVETALHGSQSFFECIESKVRSKKDLSRISIFEECGIVNVSLDLTSGEISDEIRRSHDTVEELTKAGLVIKPGRVWIGTLGTINTKYSGFKEDSEELLNYSEFDLQYIELGPGIIKRQSLETNGTAELYSATPTSSTAFFDSLQLK